MIKKLDSDKSIKSKGEKSQKDLNLGLGKQKTDKKEKKFNFGKDEYLRLQAERNQVVFDADFEGANLECVRRRKRGEYDIFIRCDSNGSRQFNWFYFKMKNSADFTDRVKIRIVNMTKENSLF